MTDKHNDLTTYRDAYQRILDERAEPGPTNDELAQLVTGELTGDEREAVVMQMLRSPDAIRRHQLLEELHRETRVGSRPLRRPWLQPMAVAASLVLAVAIWQWLPTESPDARRSDGAYSSPSNNVLLEASPQRFRWSAEAGARRYRVTLYDNAGLQAWQSNWTTDTEVSLPPGLQLPGNSRHYWQVEIDGNSARRTLGPYWFRIE